MQIVYVLIVKALFGFMLIVNGKYVFFIDYYDMDYPPFDFHLR
jgi:hypothetical protein